MISSLSATHTSYQMVKNTLCVSRVLVYDEHHII